MASTEAPASAKLENAQVNLIPEPDANCEDECVGFSSPAVPVSSDPFDLCTLFKSTDSKGFVAPRTEETKSPLSPAGQEGGATPRLVSVGSSSFLADDLKQTKTTKSENVRVTTTTTTGSRCDSTLQGEASAERRECEAAFPAPPVPPPSPPVPPPVRSGGGVGGAGRAETVYYPSVALERRASPIAGADEDDVRNSMEVDEFSQQQQQRQQQQQQQQQQ